MKEKTKQLSIQHEKHLWAFFGVIFLGFWLLCSPSTFGYKSEILRSSDYITGAILIVFGLLSLSARFIIAPWILTLAGIWLEFAPLLFWAPDAISYLNDTLVGVLVIALSLLIPGVPGVIEEKGKELPIGWSYNPSAWHQRIPVIACGCIGWFIARHLAAFQLGYIDQIWDPFFGLGTKKVLTSSVASFFPVSDAGLGALAYSLETLMGAKGGSNRWRTMPWMVVIFGLLVVPLGIVSIILITLQPLLVHAWCTLCLIAGFCMLIMVIFTVDEMIAVFQFLHMAKKAGLPFWKTFFKGGVLPGMKDDTRTPTFYGNFFRVIQSMLTGAGFTWNLLLSVILGAWLMLSPSVFHIKGFTADMDHLFGALIVVISMISLAEVTRTIRFVNVLLALAICFMGFHWNHLAVAVFLIILSMRKGPINESYGTWNQYIK